MESTYYSLLAPASYGGLNKFKPKGYTKKQIREWLQSQDTHTLHKPTRRRFPRRRVVVYGIDHQWQADLVDLAKLSSYNKGFKYLLTCIDVLSPYAWVVPLTDKTGKTLKYAFQVILKSGRGSEMHRTRPPVYLIKDDHGEIQEGTFYVEELQNVIKTDDVYKIEPIFKKRKMGQRVQYLVKCLEYPESFSSWILKQDLQKHTTPT